jgi:glutathione S-transferase
MALILHAHPFSSYCWKALIALHEGTTPFSLRLVEDAAGWAELEALWPLRKFPVLRDGVTTIAESSIIVEYLARRHPEMAALVPADGDAALAVRFMDRCFDNHVMTPMQKLVADRMRAQGEHDPAGVAQARKALDTAYAWLETRLAADAWAAGPGFTLADCAGAPALFYADWVHPLGERYPRVLAYRQRVLARPSVARVVEEARPYRQFFPGGAPDRD